MFDYQSLIDFHTEVARGVAHGGKERLYLPAADPASFFKPFTPEERAYYKHLRDNPFPPLPWDAHIYNEISRSDTAQYALLGAAALATTYGAYKAYQWWRAAPTNLKAYAGKCANESFMYRSRSGQVLCTPANMLTHPEICFKRIFGSSGGYLYCADTAENRGDVEFTAQFKALQLQLAAAPVVAAEVAQIAIKEEVQTQKIGAEALQKIQQPGLSEKKTAEIATNAVKQIASLKRQSRARIAQIVSKRPRRKVVKRKTAKRPRAKIIRKR